MSSNSKLVGIGFSNMVNMDHLIAVLSPNSSGGKRIVTVAKERSMLIDATAGRKTRSIIVMDNEMVITSGLNPQTILARVQEDGEVIDE